MRPCDVAEPDGTQTKEVSRRSLARNSHEFPPSRLKMTVYKTVPEVGAARRAYERKTGKRDGS